MEEKSGAPIVFDDLVRENYAMVVSYSATLLGGRGESEDIAQDVFVVAWRRLEDFDTSRRPGPWLRGIARNLARNAARAHKPMMYLDESALEWIESIHAKIEARAGDVWPDKLDALDDCLARLNDADGRYVSMRYTDRCSYKTISETLRTGVENVRKRLYRIRLRLADCVTKRLEATDG